MTNQILHHLLKFVYHKNFDSGDKQSNVGHERQTIKCGTFITIMCPPVTSVNNVVYHNTLSPRFHTCGPCPRIIQ
jgi:hypothetical protein